MYNNCPASYKLVLLDDAIRNLKVNKRNAVEGAVGHNMLEIYYKHGLTNQEWFKENVDRFFESFITENLIEWKGTTEEEKKADKEKSIQETRLMMDNMVGIINNYKLFPKECKPEFSFKFNLTSLIEFAGRMDMWMLNTEDLCLLLDWKFTKNKSSPDMRQLMGYKLACDSLNLKVDKIGFVYPWFNEIVWKTLDSVNSDNYIEELTQVANGVKDNRFPYTPSKFRCSRCDCRVVCGPYKLLRERELSTLLSLHTGANEI